MHILTAAHDFYPDPGAGGTGRYVSETARRLVHRGHRVSVVTRRRGAVPAREVIDGVTVYRYDLEIADRPAPGVLAQLPEARAAVGGYVSAISAEAPPDLLSVQGPVTSLLVGRQLEPSVPAVSTFHSPWSTEYRIRTRSGRWWPRRWLNAAVRRRLEHRMLGKSARVVTLSSYMAAVLEQVHGAGFEPTVIPGGVDIERFSPLARPPRRALPGQPAILTVRRLAERMGHETLLNAFSSVVTTHPTAHLYIAGDGPLRRRLERTVTRLNLGDRTTFLGYVPDDDLPGVYAAADLFVLPTTALEGFGLATLEAMASGTPVVASPVGGTVEVLSGVVDHPAIPEPMLAAAATPDALAARILDWASIPAGELSVAGRASRGFVRDRFPWKRTVTQLESCYASVLG